MGGWLSHEQSHVAHTMSAQENMNISHLRKRKIIDSKVPNGMKYVIGPRRVSEFPENMCFVDL